MAIFKGAAVAIVTPIHEDKTVNFEKLGELIQNKNATEFDAAEQRKILTLTQEEHIEMIKYSVQKVAQEHL